MFDFGFAELLLIIVLIVLVMGPKEIPVVMRQLGRIVRRLQYVRFAVSQQFEDFMRTHDLDINNQVNFEAGASKEDPLLFDEAEADEDMYVPEEEDTRT